MRRYISSIFFNLRYVIYCVHPFGLTAVGFNEGVKKITHAGFGGFPFFFFNAIANLCPLNIPFNQPGRFQFF